MARRSGESSRARFAAYVERLTEVIGHADRAGPLRDYCTGLLMPAERKSVEPIAAVTAPARVAAQHQSLLHFVANAPWAAALQRGEIIAGVILDPIRDDWAISVAGEGAWIENNAGRQINLRVAPPPPVSEMSGIVNWLFFSAPVKAQITASLSRVAAAVDYRCAAHQYRAVASGHYDFALYGNLLVAKAGKSTAIVSWPRLLSMRCPSGPSVRCSSQGGSRGLVYAPPFCSTASQVEGTSPQRGNDLRSRSNRSRVWPIVWLTMSSTQVGFG